jgi:hypothetical protein
MLVVYRNEGDLNPLNVIVIRNSEIKKTSDTECEIVNQYRSYQFSVEEPVRYLKSFIASHHNHTLILFDRGN